MGRLRVQPPAIHAPFSDGAMGPRPGLLGSSLSSKIPYQQAIMASGPLWYWRLDEVAGSNAAVDQTPNANAGTYATVAGYQQVPGATSDNDSAILFGNGAFQAPRGLNWNTTQGAPTLHARIFTKLAPGATTAGSIGSLGSNSIIAYSPMLTAGLPNGSGVAPFTTPGDFALYLWPFGNSWYLPGTLAHDFRDNAWHAIDWEVIGTADTSGSPPAGTIRMWVDGILSIATDSIDDAYYTFAAGVWTRNTPCYRGFPGGFKFGDVRETVGAGCVGTNGFGQHNNPFPGLNDEFTGWQRPMGQIEILSQLSNL